MSSITLPLRRGLYVAGFVAWASAGTPALAQSNRLSALLLRFFSLEGAGQDLVAAVTTTHPNHFLASQPDAQNTMILLNRGIAVQLATLPLGSSSGGFSYTFEPSVGLYRRGSASFGSLFGERAVTIGRGKLDFGLTQFHRRFDEFEGRSLSGAMAFYLFHRDVNGDGSALVPYYEGDRLQADLFLDLSADTLVAFANFGVTDKLDVGLMVPYVHLDMDARFHLTIRHFSTAPDPFAIHTFAADASVDEKDVSQAGSADGLGDIVVRAKYRLKKIGAGGFAAGVDLRFPTGDDQDLLGSGATQAKFSAIASGPGARFSPHVNLGYTLSEGGAPATGDLPDEVSYTAGFDAAPHPRVTVSADLLGRTLLNAERLVGGEEAWRYVTRAEIGDDGLPRDVRTVGLPRLEVRKGSLNLVTGALGVRVNPFENLLVSASVLFSLADRGLQDRFTPVISVDYSF